MQTSYARLGPARDDSWSGGLAQGHAERRFADDVLTRAAAWFAARGVIVRRMLTDNGTSYRIGQPRITACQPLGMGCRFLQPGRP